MIKITRQKITKEKIEDIKKLAVSMYLVIAFSFFPVFYPFSEKADTVNQSIEAEEKTKRQVVLGGEPFGIKLYSKGIMVVEISDVDTPQGNKSPAKEAGIEEKDIITEANGHKLKTNEELSEIIGNCGENGIQLTVVRSEQTFYTTLYPVVDVKGVLRAGMWIRDSAAGLGTITYYDVENSLFGSLGHGICDTDTEEIIPVDKGQVLTATITDAEKSVKGEAGGLKGYFDSGIIGNAIVNCELGVYGTCDITPSSDKPLLETADKSEICQGEALIYCTIEGNTPEYYQIYIDKVNGGDEKTKNMVIRVTDSRLLEKTGGIVQGMSGSPIIQNGKLVGAVTHVFVNHPDKGYGIFIENMLEISDSLIE